MSRSNVDRWIEAFYETPKAQPDTSRLWDNLAMAAMCWKAKRIESAGYRAITDAWSILEFGKAIASDFVPARGVYEVLMEALQGKVSK